MIPSSARAAPKTRLPDFLRFKIHEREGSTSRERSHLGATKLKDAAQLPGAAFIDRDGVVRWIYRGEPPGDLPPMRDMVEIARKS